jgi:NAD(P)-dependent dehydrogenase (short-subunit alcohol dehydrogenase family)
MESPSESALESPLNLSGRVAVVIGATSGIGHHIALGLVRHGAEVVPTGRRMDLLEETWEKIEELGATRTLAQAVDVTDRRSLEAFRDGVMMYYDGVDILVNAAGFTAKTATATMPDTEWSALIDTNLTGALRACQCFYAPLKDSGHGRIINIASLGSFLAFHQVAAYCASKAGLLSLTRSLACEWARDGICVNAIAPGIFPSELNSKLVRGPRGKEILMRTPMGRFGRMEELVGAAVLLASDAASFITGQCLAVDGGYLASGVNS